MKAKNKGFTLGELMVVLIILAIIVAFAIPAITGFKMRHEGHSVLDALKQNLTLAQSSAIKEDKDVTICRSEDQLTCSGSWSDGYIVFVDQTEDHVVNANDRLLKAVKLQLGKASLNFKGFPSSKYIQFATSGRLKTGNGTFTYAAQDGKELTLTINKSGRIR